MRTVGTVFNTTKQETNNSSNNNLVEEWLKKNKPKRLDPDPRLEDSISREMDLRRKAYKAQNFLKRKRG